MKTYALDYECGETRQVALRQRECVFNGGQLRETPEAIHAAKARLEHLDKRLQVSGQRLGVDEAPKVIPFPHTPPSATAPPPSQSAQTPQTATPLPPFDLVFYDGGMRPRPSQGNIVVALRRLRVQPTYDEFTRQTSLVLTDLKRRRVETELLTDINENKLWLLIEESFHFLPPRELFRAVLLNEASKHAYHPVREYLYGLKWDATPRISRWLVSLAGAPDTEYVRRVSSIVLVAAVRRVRQPGVKFDELVVLEGIQGVDKSSGLKALCPDPSWFSDCLPLNAQPKEVIEQTAGKWIIEVAELSGISGAKVEQLKAMLSRQVDSARMAYGHHRIETQRQWVAFGTTNDSKYLRDSTGNRRFWPIAVQKFDVSGITAIRDQLWAEAAAREAVGESIRLPEGLWKDAAEEQEQRYETDPWEDELRHNLSVHTWPNGPKRVTRRDLYRWVGKNIAHAMKTDNMRLKEVMTRLGWRSMTVNVNGKPEQGYGCDT